MSSKLAEEEEVMKIRLVHLNGWTEEFEDAMTVAQVTGGDKQQHFVFAQAQLATLLNSKPKPLDSATQLQKGSIYFLLPLSIFNTEMSPIDLATISKRLTLAAAAHKPSRIDNKKKKKKKQSKLEIRNRYADRYVPPRINEALGDVDVNNDKQNTSWKPILESITERSFTRAESDSSHQDQDHRY